MSRNKDILTATENGVHSSVKKFSKPQVKGNNYMTQPLRAVEWFKMTGVKIKQSGQ